MIIQVKSDFINIDMISHFCITIKDDYSICLTYHNGTDRADIEISRLCTNEKMAKQFKNRCETIIMNTLEHDGAIARLDENNIMYFIEQLDDGEV